MRTSIDGMETAAITVESPRLRALLEGLHAPEAEREEILPRFWVEMEQAGTPLIEPVDELNGAMLVTFLWRESEPTAAVKISESVSWRPPADRQLAKLEGTDIWYLSWRIASTIRTSYSFIVTLEGEEAPEGIWPESRHDPFNQHLRPSDWEADQFESVLIMPDAEPLPWDLPPGGALRGQLHAEHFVSEVMGNERPVWIYTPPGFDPNGPAYPLVVIFDGEAFHGAPYVLDALIAEGKLPPMVAVLVNQIGIRNQELPCNPEFSRMIAKELVPWLREEWNATDDPARSVLNGCSFGGLCSAYTALKHPDVFGNVVMQSGSCWYHPSVMEAYRNPAAPSEQVVGIPAAIPTIISEYMAAEPVPVRIYQECGDVENGPPPARIWQVFGNRWLHDILTLKGYDTTYREFSGGHDDAWWRGTFADGMRWVFPMDREV